jgi:hypothetical protein
MSVKPMVVSFVCCANYVVHLRGAAGDQTRMVIFLDGHRETAEFRRTDGTTVMPITGELLKLVIQAQNLLSTVIQHSHAAFEEVSGQEVQAPS